MHIDELKYFVEAAKEQNLNKAAKTLGTTQSTLSHAIKRLENEFDCRLFAKSGKSIVLTPEGRKFSETAIAIIRSISELKNEVGSGIVPIAGHLRVSGTLGVAVQLLTESVLNVGATSNSTIEITSQRSAEILKKVAAKELDFGLCFEPQPYPEVIARPVAQSISVLVVNQKHPLLKTIKKEGPNALFRYPWAHPKHLPGVASCTSHPIFSVLEKQPKVRFFYDSYETAYEILKATDAWALMPKALLPNFPLLKHILKEYQEPIRLFLVHHQDANTHLVTHLFEQLQTAAVKKSWSVVS